MYVAASAAIELPCDNGISPHICLLPYFPKKSLTLIALTRAVNQSIPDGYCRERVIVLAIQAKAALTLYPELPKSMRRRTGG